MIVKTHGDVAGIPHARHINVANTTFLIQKKLCPWQRPKSLLVLSMLLTLSTCSASCKDSASRVVAFRPATSSRLV